MKNNDLLHLAKQIAFKAHKGQYRRDGITPYIEHPLGVAEKVETEDEKIVALLHDVIEDTPETAQSLKDKGIPDHLVEAVEVLTKSDGMCYREYLKRVDGNVLAKKVKIADMLYNLADAPSPYQVQKYMKGLAYFQHPEPTE